VVGPEEPFTFADLMETCRGAAGSDATFTWVEPAFLLEQEVEPWSELPLWLPGPEWAGLMRHDNRRAIQVGLAFRSLEETVGDTLSWDSKRAGKTMPAGIDREREAELLGAWHRASNATPD
jgi:2'-hydroxyisoflavone reductase